MFVIVYVYFKTSPTNEANYKTDVSGLIMQLLINCAEHKFSCSPRLTARFTILLLFHNVCVFSFKFCCSSDSPSISLLLFPLNAVMKIGDRFHSLGEATKAVRKFEKETHELFLASKNRSTMRKSNNYYERWV